MYKADFADRNRVIAASRWLLLLFLSAMLVIVRTQVGTSSQESLVPAFVVGALACLVATFALNISGLQGVASGLLLLADFVLAAVFASLSQENGLILVLAGSALMI